MDIIINVIISNSSLIDLIGFDYVYNLIILYLFNIGVIDYVLVVKIFSLINFSIVGDNLINDLLFDLNNLLNIINLNLSFGKFDNNVLIKFNKMFKLSYLNLDSNFFIINIMLLKFILNLVILFV